MWHGLHDGFGQATVAAIADEWMRVSGTTISTGTNRQANAVNAAIQIAATAWDSSARSVCPTWWQARA